MLPPQNCQSASPQRIHLFFAACSFTAIAVYGSLVPLQYEPLKFSEAVSRFRDIPFLQLSVESRADWVANILLFVPLGALWLAAIALDRSRRFGLAAALFVLPLCTALSIAVEFAQLWFPNRTVSQNDIIAETLGALAGIILWLLLGSAAMQWLRQYSSDLRPKKQRDWLLQAYLAGFLIYALMPFDLTISVAEIYRKYTEGRILLIPFSHSYDSLLDVVYELTTDVLVWVPIGAWTATAFTARDRPVRPWLWCALWSAALVAGVEMAQLFVYSRYVDVTDVLTGTFGIAIGAGIMGWRSDSGSQGVPAAESMPLWRGLPWACAALLYIGVLLVLFWNPFDFTLDRHLARSRWESFFRVPFAALYYGSEFHALQQVLRKLLLFAPLGALVSQMVAPLRWPARPLAIGALFTCIFAVAMGIELGQLILPSHTADLTDALLCTIGATLGMAVALRWTGASATGARPWLTTGGLGTPQATGSSENSP